MKAIPINWSLEDFGIRFESINIENWGVNVNVQPAGSSGNITLVNIKFESTNPDVTVDPFTSCISIYVSADEINRIMKSKMVAEK